MGYRYIGSKDKLSDIIISEIRSFNPTANRIIDLMAGTGLFSLALRENNFVVTSVDMMTYSYHHLTVHLRLNKAPKFESVFFISNNGDKLLSNYEKILTYLNELTPVKGYFYKEFSPEGSPSNTDKQRKYFTSHNASKIDAIRAEIRNLKENGLITSDEHSLLVHDLIMAVNDIANIAGTYGHYLSKFVKRAEAPIILRPSTFSNKGTIDGHEILKGYAEEISAKITGDICYIDPPYNKRQYAANYHILETIAREDNPEAIGDSGLRPWRDQYSNFCSKLKILGSIDKIITNLACPQFIISYSEDGLLPVEELINYLSKYGSVYKKDVEYKRFKSNDSKKSAILNEYLIFLTKN